MTALTPSQIVELALEELAYNGDTVTQCDELWTIIKGFVPWLDEFYKSIVWRWLVSRGEDFEVFVDSKEGTLAPAEDIGLSYDALLKKYPNLGVRAGADLLWLKLTGQTKANSVIGDHPFQLLCAVARSRAKGISSIDLHHDTKQDSRSITGRLNSLQSLGLLKKYPIVTRGAWTYLNVYWKFIDSNRENTDMLTGNNSYDLTNLRSSVMNLVKTAQNGIRQLRDLRTELGFTNTYRAKVNFTSAVRKLASQGYVERIFVYKRDDPDRKYYCIKFLKDLPADDDLDDSEDEEGNELNDFSDEEGETVQNADELKPEPTDLQDFSSMSVVQTSPSNESRARVLFNQYYPLENQLCYLIEQSGVRGVPGVEVAYKLTGSTYLRIITRIFNLFVGNGNLAQAKMNKYLTSPMGYLVIIRGVDFSARMKFYRYFSNAAYTEFTNAVKHPSWGEFRVLAAKQDLSLVPLERKSLTPISGRASVHWHENGVPEVIYFGEVGKKRASGIFIETAPAVASSKPRGRPRKTPKVENGTSLSGEVGGVVQASPTPARRQGRPRKSKLSTPDTDPIVSSKSAAEDLSIMESNIAPQLQNPNLMGIELDLTPTESTIDPAVSETRKRTRASVGHTLETPKRQRTRNSTEPTQKSIESGNASNGHTDGPGESNSTIIEKSSSKKIKQSTIDSFFSGNRPQSRANSVFQETETIETLEGNSTSQPASSVLMDVDMGNSEGLKEISSEVNFQTSTNTPSKTEEVFTTESQVSKAIEAASQLYREGRIDLESSIPDKNVKQPNLSSGGNISIVMMKRVDQVVKLLKANNGIMQSGMKLVHALNENFSNENGSLMDKKTVNKVLKHLEESGEVWQLFVNVPSKTGVQNVKSLLFDKSIGRDDPIVEMKKEELVNEVRVLAVHPQLKTEQLDFKIYSQKIKEIDQKRREMREQKIREREARRRKPEQRLARKDKERIEAQRKRAKRSTTADRAKKRHSYINGADDAVVQPSRKVGHGMEGEDPLLSLPLQNHQFRNSKRISLAREEPTEPARRSSLRHARKRISLTITTDMFFRIAIITRSLYSGSHNIISWDKVASAIPKMSADHAKSIWPRIRDTYGDTKKIDLIMRGWEKIFLQAYEDGEIPIYRNGNYDLAFLARFWRHKFPRIHEQSDVPLLFDDPKYNEELFTFKPAESVSHHDAFFHTPSMTRHQKLLVQWSMAFPKKPVDIPISTVSKAKVGIKAIIATTDENYNMEKAKKILDDFGDSTCTTATHEMDQERAIVYVPRSHEKMIPGRNFVFSEKFMSTLHHRLGPYAFYELAGYYDELLKTLNESKGYIMARMAPDSSLVGVLDMICYEKVDLVRVNTVDHIGGLNHNSRAIDKNKWECDIVVRTPLRYVESGERIVIEPVKRPTENPIPLGEPCSTIWTDINGYASHPILRKLVYWMLMYIESRPGVTLESIHNRIQFILTSKEIITLLGWLERQNCVRKGESDGYWTLPEWYSYIGVN